MVQQIKLMADYQSYPLWWAGPHAPGNIDPRILPLKPETVLLLKKWAGIFDSWMDLRDPASSAEPTHEQVTAFEEEGVRLWKQLRAELSPGYEVFYKSIKLARVLKNPDELKKT